MNRSLPEWAEWSAPRAQPSRWTLGVEEEVMLLDPSTWSLAPVIDSLLPLLSPELAAHVSAETNAGMLELATGVHGRVGDAIAELAGLRQGLNDELSQAGLSAAAAGTHPTTVWHESRVSMGARYQLLEASMRELTRREPTFALHVHVGVPDPELAIAVMNRMRGHLPALLALSANSPFLRGRETGLASTRTPLFQAFPRVGIPRAYRSYADWVGAITPLLDAGAFPEPTFLWWDIRPQPRLGTLEIRIMDSQTTLDEVAALVALTQCLVVMEATDRFAPAKLLDSPEVLEENRFLAARDGMDAEFVDPRTHGRVRARVLVEEMVSAARLHAGRLGCLTELDLVLEMVRTPPCRRQRELAERGGGARAAVAAMAEAFSGRQQSHATSEAAVA